MGSVNRDAQKGYDGIADPAADADRDDLHGQNIQRDHRNIGKSEIMDQKTEKGNHADNAGDRKHVLISDMRLYRSVFPAQRISQKPRGQS